MLNNGSTDAEPVLHMQALISFTDTFGYASSAAALLRADMAIAADSDTFVVLPFVINVISFASILRETILRFYN